MPVLIGPDGKAVDVAPDQVDPSLSQGYGIPLNDPQGNPVVAKSMQDAQSMLQSGHSQPSSGQLQNMLSYSKYSTPGQKIIAGLEGVGQGVSFGLSTGLEKLLGVPAEDIQGRAEVDKPEEIAGQGLGIAGSALIPGVGEANVLSHLGASAGEVAVKAGLGTVGSMAVNGAVQTALVSSGNEVSKMFADDPHQTLETALTNIGLGAAFGAGGGAILGVVPKVWEQAEGTTVGKYMNAIVNKANGINQTSVPDDVESNIAASGLQIDPAVKAVLSGNPEVQGMFQKLAAGTSSSAQKAQAAMNEFKTEAHDALLNSLNKTPEEVEALQGMSDFDAGAAIKGSLKDEIQSQYSPLAQQFENLKTSMQAAPFPQSASDELANKLAGLKQKFAVSPSSPEFQKLNNIINELPNVHTLDDFKNFQSIHLGDVFSKQMWALNQPLRQAFRDSEENVIMDSLGKTSPEILPQLQQARQGYNQLMNNVIDPLNDRLHVGSYDGVGTFLNKLNDMQEERVLSRMTPKKDAGFLNLMNQNLPDTAGQVQDAYLNQLLKNSAQRAQAGQVINPKTLFGNLDKWGPELKNFALPGGAEPQINAIRSLMSAIPTTGVRTYDNTLISKILSQVPAGAGAMISHVMGGNPLIGAAIGRAAQFAATETPDAMQLAVLKMLGSNAPIDAGAIKAAADFASAVHGGNDMLNSAASKLFQGSLPEVQNFSTSQKDVNSLKDSLDDMGTHPAQLLNLGGKLGHYLPDQATALGIVAQRAVQYLRAMKPQTEPTAPLDNEHVPSTTAQMTYDRQVGIAQNPISVINYMKQGNLLPQDVQTVKTIYPAIYQRLANAIQDKMMDLHTSGKTIPYRLKTTIGTFLGQQVTATQSPSAISMAQAVWAPRRALPQQGKKKGAMPQKSDEAMQKMNDMYQTPVQQNEERRAGASEA